MTDRSPKRNINNRNVNKPNRTVIFKTSSVHMFFIVGGKMGWNKSFFFEDSENNMELIELLENGTPHFVTYANVPRYYTIT